MDPAVAPFGGSRGPAGGPSGVPLKFWDIKKIGDTARGRYRVRWAVEGREHCKSFTTKALADAFLVTLKDAARDGKPFDPATGLPARPKRAAPATATWYEHARAYAQMKWPDLAAKSRRSVAEALTTITLALTGQHRNAPDPAVVRRACSATRSTPPASAGPPPARSPAHWSGSRRHPRR